MSFPLHYSGRVTWRSRTGVHSEQLQQEVLAQLAKALTNAKGSPAVRGNRVLFTGGLFRFVSNWNVLIPITAGYVEVQPVDDYLVIAYELNFKQIMGLASIIACLLFVMSVVVDHSVPVAKFILCALVWGSLFGLNFLMAIVRFPMFISSALKRL